MSSKFLKKNDVRNNNNRRLNSHGLCNDDAAQ